MTGVKKISSCGVAALLSCGSAMAAAPTGDFDAWTVSNGAIISTDACPAGFSCTTATTGDGFYQRPIEGPEEQQHFGTIVTDSSSNDQTPQSLTFSTFQTEPITGLSGTTGFGHNTFYYFTPNAFPGGTIITDAAYSRPDLSLYSATAIGPLLSGKNNIGWHVTKPDGSLTIIGNTTHITPSISFGPDQIAAEGSSVAIKAYLNGTPKKYPVTIPFTLSGTATSTEDHNGKSGEIIIESGLSGEVTIQIHDDGISDAGETITVEMGDLINLTKRDNSIHTITISEQGQPPLIDLSIKQGSIQSRIISTLSDNASITTEIKNLQTEAQLSYDWSATDNAIVPSNGYQQSSLEFAPNSLTPGIYKARLTVTDSNNLKTNKEIAFAVVNTEIPGTDKENVDHDYDGLFEGAGDNDKDGLPDFVDFNKLTNNYIFNLYHPNPLAPNNPSLSFNLEAEEDTLGLSIEAPYIPNHQEIPYMIETQPGLHLSRGEFSLLLDHHFQISSLVPRSLIQPADPLYSAQGDFNEAQINSGLAHNVSNFVINGLPNAAGTATFVLPLPETISDTPLSFRVLLPSSDWQSFDETSDSIASTTRNGHLCPPPNASAYQAGLNSGDDCLLFSVKDGGPNDSDEQTNGSITIALGALIGIEAEPRVLIEDQSIDSPAEKGGTGGLASWFLLLAALGLGLRHNAHISTRRA